MKILRTVLFGLALSVGLLSGAQAHGPQIGISVQAGYPAYYVTPPAIYYPPAPVIYEALPLPYAPRVVVPPYPYQYGGYYYEGPRYGWYGYHGHHHGGHRHHWR